MHICILASIYRLPWPFLPKRAVPILIAVEKITNPAFPVNAFTFYPDTGGVDGLGVGRAPNGT